VKFATRDLRPGETETISGTLTPGSYVTFCSLPGHESLGIKGTLTVTG
jgi:Copper binding proteins, plastocyanin/azurin family.